MARDTTVIRCPSCGGTREISVRQKRRITNGSRSLLCSLCRTIPEPAIVTQADRDYWLKSQTPEWIKETATMIWGDE